MPDNANPDRAESDRGGEKVARANPPQCPLLAADPFSRWLGIEVAELTAGRCRARMTIRPEMSNGYQVCHGGVLFCLADSAVAFAAAAGLPDSGDSRAITFEGNASLFVPVLPGDVVAATATQERATRRFAVYSVEIERLGGGEDNRALVGVVRATVMLR